MHTEFRTESRDVGLAETRYVTPEAFEYRRQVAQCMREIAALNESSWILPGYEEIDRKRGMLRRQADRLETCGLEYAVVYCRDCSRPLLGSRRCECRVCPDCAKKYAARIRKHQQELIKRLQPTKTHRLAMLTLTKRTHPGYMPTSSQIKTCYQHVRSLMNSLYPKRLGCGGLAVLELGQNQNLHFHLIVYGYYVPQRKISDLWARLTGDSPVVHIQAVRNPRDALNYLLKYITKPRKSADPKETAYYLNLLLGLRRIRTYGIFYGCRLVAKPGCPCPVCGGKLRLHGFIPGPFVPETALFFEEALKLTASPEKATQVKSIETYPK
jgi:hypothetical protein